MQQKLISQYQKFNLVYLFIILSLWPSLLFSQKLDYSHLNQNANEFQNYLSNNDNYFAGGSLNYPYFQGKLSKSYIKFYKLNEVTVIEIESAAEYFKIIEKIRSEAIFLFKFCADYSAPIVYNYETSSGNKIRFNFSEMTISVSYPSKISSLLERNYEIISTVFVCLSEEAYSYHTNLRCSGLGNCKVDIAKTNIREAKKYNYKFCEICTTDSY